MTVLSDTDILHELEETERWDQRGRESYDGLRIEPFDEENLQPASYDLTLGNEWIVPVMSDPPDRPIDIEDGLPSSSKREYTVNEFVINSMQNPEAEGSSVDSAPFVLGCVEESIDVPAHIGAKVEGRSSIGRLGVIIHTAGWGDPGFGGQLTLEMVNLSPNPIKLEAGMRIAQVVFKYTESPAEEPYGEQEGSKYQGQTGVTESRIEEDNI